MAKAKFKRIDEDYVEVDGEIYERLVGQTESLTVDLTEDTIAMIDKSLESGKYVSRGDVVRSALRLAIDEYYKNLPKVEIDESLLKDPEESAEKDPE